jgi:hypothetical protein
MESRTSMTPSRVVRTDRVLFISALTNLAVGEQPGCHMQDDCDAPCELISSI